MRAREVALVVGTTIVIPSLTADSVASRTLNTEGVQHAIALMKKDTDYARLLTTFWRRGQSFIVLEDDMAPWPGALNALSDCDHDWCAYNYALSPGRLEGYRGLGCVKFSARLLTQHPYLFERWAGTHWSELDDAVFQAVAATGLDEPHEHDPPMAHVKHYGR